MSSYKQIDLNPKTPDPELIETGSYDYLAGLSSSLNNYPGGLQYFQIPCYVSTVQHEYDTTKPLPYSIHNTLYLDVVCPSVKPEMIVISKDMSRNIDFGRVSIGQKCIKKISIKNISNSPIEVIFKIKFIFSLFKKNTYIKVLFFKLKSKILDTKGPFTLLNTLRPIDPGYVHSLIVAFIPSKACVVRVFEISKSSWNFKTYYNLQIFEI